MCEIDDVALQFRVVEVCGYTDRARVRGVFGDGHHGQDSSVQNLKTKMIFCV